MFAFRTIAAGACDFEKMLDLLHSPDAALQPVAVGALAAELVHRSLCESGTPHLLEVAQVNNIVLLEIGNHRCSQRLSS